MTVDQQFNTINDKLQILLKKYQRLLKENDRLKDELQKAKDIEANMLEKIEGFQQEAAILKLGAGTMSEKDKKAFEKKLSQYVKEIDKCISFLSQ